MNDDDLSGQDIIIACSKNAVLFFAGFTSSYDFRSQGERSRESCEGMVLGRRPGGLEHST